MICLLVRDLAISQEKRLNPSLPTNIPLILYQAGKYRPKVIAPDDKARQDGVTAGAWLGQARTLSPYAHFLPADETRYQRIFEDVTLQLLSITDRLECEYQPTSAVWYTDDAFMLKHLITAIAEQTGIQAQVGIARTKFASRVAAASARVGEVITVSAGDEAAFLAPYSVTVLPLDKKMKRRLPLLGLDTLGQLAALPRIAVWEQFGKQGRWVHELASGKDIRPLSPHKAPEIIRETHDFDEAVADRQILYQVLEQLSLRLVETLNGREASVLTLILEMDDTSVLDYQRQPHEPVRDALYTLRLLRGMLDSLPVNGAISEIEVRLSDIVQRAPKQLSLFDERKPVTALHEIAPTWARRHRSADFYRLILASDSQRPETAVEKQKIIGA